MGTRRIQSCINMDEDNIKWLKKQERGISKTVNDIVKVLRENADLLITVKSRVVKEGEEITEATLAANAILLKTEHERHEKIRAFFRDQKHLVYLAKTQRKFSKAHLCRIKDELYYGKYNLLVNVDEIRKVLKEEMDTFDVAAYEKERGIVREKDRKVK